MHPARWLPALPSLQQRPLDSSSAGRSPFSQLTIQVRVQELLLLHLYLILHSRSIRIPVQVEQYWPMPLPPPPLQQQQQQHSPDASQHPSQASYAEPSIAAKSSERHHPLLRLTIAQIVRRLHGMRKGHFASIGVKLPVVGGAAMLLPTGREPAIRFLLLGT